MTLCGKAPARDAGSADEPSDLECQSRLTIICMPLLNLTQQPRGAPRFRCTFGEKLWTTAVQQMLGKVLDCLPMLGMLTISM